MESTTYTKHLHLGIFEYLLYTSLDHPAIPKPLSFEMTKKRAFTMVLPKGVPVNIDHFTPQSFNKYLTSILSALLYMEDHGICYGDIKNENTICIDGKYYLIDFGLFDHVDVPSTNVQQSYECPEQACYRKMDSFRVASPDTVKEDLNLEDAPAPYDHQKEFIWAVGIFIYRIIRRYIMELRDFHYLKITPQTNLPPMFFGYDVPWNHFLAECFAPFSTRKRYLRDIVYLLPGPLLEQIEFINKASYRPGNYFPTRLHLTYTNTEVFDVDRDPKEAPNLGDVIYAVSKVSLDIPQRVISQAILLQGRLTDRFLKEIESSTLSDQLKSELLYVLCVFLLGQHLQIFDSFLGFVLEALPSLLAYPTSEIIEAESSFYKVIGFRYPDLFFQ